MFENPRRGRQARNFTTNFPKILDLNRLPSENWGMEILGRVRLRVRDKFLLVLLRGANVILAGKRESRCHSTGGSKLSEKFNYSATGINFSGEK